MNGMTLSELRAAGAAIRHQSGVNTCARCSLHFFQHGAAAEEGGCAVHTAEASAATAAYPCCSQAVGSRGCTAAAHLPLFQTVDGHIQPNRRIPYEDGVDLHVGHWVSTRMSLAQLAKETAALESEPQSAASSSSSSSDAAPGGPVSAPSAASAIPAIPHNPANLGAPVERLGDELMICGQLYHTGTPVVLWGDVGGYDHYRVVSISHAHSNHRRQERRFCPIDEADWATTQKEVPSFTTPNRFGLRAVGLTPAQVEKVRGGQWDLKTLQQQVTQLVLHYDEAGLSRECFRILQDERDLSIQLMCDLDGTIYQALDLKERAWQATTSNTCSVGIEIANVGSYSPSGPTPFAQWYRQDQSGNTTITIPAQYGDGGIRTPGFVGSPARPNAVLGNIQGQDLAQFDFTPQQYAALSKIVAAFCTVFPDIPASYPRDAQGNLITCKLPDATLANYKGVLGHFHIQTNKIDPGPAMQWDKLIGDAQKIMAQAKEAKEIAAKEAKVKATMPVASAAAAASAADVSVIRKLERKVLQAAEDAAAATLQPSDPFYLVEGAWWAAWKAWLSGQSDVRPSAVSNLSLLQADERSPRAGLTFQRDYRTVHKRVWDELVELYGADATIVRPSTDIYAASAKAAEKTAPAAAPAASSAPAAAAAAAPAASASSSSSSSFVVPVISTDSDEPWVVVTKRVTA